MSFSPLYVDPALEEERRWAGQKTVDEFDKGKVENRDIGESLR